MHTCDWQRLDICIYTRLQMQVHTNPMHVDKRSQTSCGENSLTSGIDGENALTSLFAMTTFLPILAFLL